MKEELDRSSILLIMGYVFFVLVIYFQTNIIKLLN